MKATEKGHIETYRNRVRELKKRGVDISAEMTSNSIHLQK